jgi:hypothetical protein
MHASDSRSERTPTEESIAFALELVGCAERAYSDNDFRTAEDLYNWCAQMEVNILEGITQLTEEAADLLADPVECLEKRLAGLAASLRVSGGGANGNKGRSGAENRCAPNLEQAPPNGVPPRVV